jgi:hypothetical protein
VISAKTKNGLAGTQMLSAFTAGLRRAARQLGFLRRRTSSFLTVIFEQFWPIQAAVGLLLIAALAAAAGNDGQTHAKDQGPPNLPENAGNNTRGGVYPRQVSSCFRRSKHFRLACQEKKPAILR